MRHDLSADTPRPWQARWARARTPADGPAGGIGQYHGKMASFFWLPDRTLCTMTLGCCAAMVCCGLLLRSVMVPPPALAAACLAAVAAAPVVCSAVRRVADGPGRDDGWAGQEQARWRALPVQLRCGLALDGIQDYLDEVPRGWWRSVHLALPLTAPGQPGVSVYPHGSRLLIVVHRGLLDQGMAPSLAVARKLAEVRGWRFQVRLVTSAAVRMGGLVIVSWAVPWPWLPAALAAVQAAMAAGGWLTELAADRHILIHHGPAEVLCHLPPPPSRDPHSRSRLECWRGWVLTAMAAAGGFLPPPARLRRALATASQLKDVTYGHA